MTADLHAPAALPRESIRGDAALLAAGVLCASSASPLIAATAAPALAIAFWRNGLAALVMAPLMLVRRHELRQASALSLRYACLAGTLLGAHFATYVPSLNYTSVASATALVSSQAMWAAVFAAALGERMRWTAWIGTALALVGVVMVTGVDLTLSPRSLLGNALALLGGVFGGAYMIVGGRARLHLSTPTYTMVCYSVAATGLLTLCLFTGSRLSGYSATAWSLIIALTVLAQLFGHSVFNLVLRTFRPSRVSLATLFTVPTATVIGAVALGETPPLAALPAFALLLLGTGMVISSRQTKSVDEATD